MSTQTVSGGGSAEAAGRFEVVADAIMYRWSVERDTWVYPSEVERVREYLAHAGINTTPLPDGAFAIGEKSTGPLGAPRLVLLAVRHLAAARRRDRRT